MRKLRLLALQELNFINCIRHLDPACIATHKTPAVVAFLTAVAHFRTNFGLRADFSPPLRNLGSTKGCSANEENWEKSAGLHSLECFKSIITWGASLSRFVPSLFHFGPLSSHFVPFFDRFFLFRPTLSHPETVPAVCPNGPACNLPKNFIFIPSRQAGKA